MAKRFAKRRLYRSRNSYISGVCAGIAEYCEFDTIVIRILAVLLALMTAGLAGIVYLFLWAYLPRSPEFRGPYEIEPEEIESSAFGQLDYMQAMGAASGRTHGPSLFVRLGIAVVLMMVFMAVAVNVSPIVPKGRWWQLWPLVFLLLGVCLVVVPIGEKWATAWHAVGIVIMSTGASLLPMSLGVVSWETIPHSFSQLWVFILVAVILFAIGASRDIGALMVAGSLCFVAYCLIAFFAYSVTGDVGTAIVVVGGGSSVV